MIYFKVLVNQNEQHARPYPDTRILFFHIDFCVAKLTVHYQHSILSTMSRRVCVTAAEGHTGYLIAELLRTDEYFASSIDSVVGFALNPDHTHCRELAGMGVTIVRHTPGQLKDVTSALQSTGADTLCLIPPAHTQKNEITSELIQAAKNANIPNICFISAAGCDIAERDKQPRLREFIDLEAQLLTSTGDPSTVTGHSQVVIRWVVFQVFAFVV